MSLLFFNRNLDPFGDKHLNKSWIFTDINGNTTLNSQQTPPSAFSNTTDSSSPVFTQNMVHNYTGMKSSGTAQYESDIISWWNYGNVSVSIRVDCSITDTSTTFRCVLVGCDSSDDCDNIFLKVDNTADSATDNAITVGLVNGEWGTTSHYQYNGSVTQGVHTITVAYDYDDTYDIRVYIDGVYVQTITIDDELYLDDAPILLQNTNILPMGVTDIMFFDTLLTDSQISDLHNNNFIGLGDRTLDPFNDGSLISAFRGVNNSTSDDELQQQLDNILPAPI